MSLGPLWGGVKRNHLMSRHPHLTSPAEGEDVYLRLANIDQLLERARARLLRVDAAHAADEQAAGALLVDIRPAYQRAAQGDIPGATVIDRNVLEWRLDPDSPWRMAEVPDHDVRIILVCAQGFQSSLAAANLQDMGLVNATDVIGGFESWVASRLPVTPPGQGIAAPAASLSQLEMSTNAEAVAEALKHGHLIDITTTGRKSGKSRRLEIMFHNIGGRLYISGIPSPKRRSWIANLDGNPKMTFHLKGKVSADLPATARIIDAEAERREILPHVARVWKRNDIDQMVHSSPLIEVTLEPSRT
jgi:deazaflavin-dependent oxidoreductase (nitroreductase family)